MAATTGDTKQEQNVEVLETVNEQETVSETAEDSETVVVQQAELDGIIRHHVYASMALGLAPIPLVDLVGLTAVQIDLVRALAKKYQVPFKKNMAKTLVAALIGGVLPVGAVPLFASLVKFIPVIGLMTGAVSMSLLGGASTYALGRVFSAHFASGGTLLDLKVEKVQASFKEQFEKGKEFVSSKTKTPAKTQESVVPE
jgi:uncharacterized protein (DUF697 family)